MFAKRSIISEAFISQNNVLDIYAEIKDYLPPQRRRQFIKAWVLNNLIKGPKKRRNFEKRFGCPLPGLINISPTERCNLSCRSCYASSYGRQKEMSIAQMEIIIQEAKKMGIYFIGILGGEPFLRSDLFPLFDRHQDVAFRISTNGTLLSSNAIDFLKWSGHVVPFFSLEGFEKETDFWRGQGVFRKIRDNMLRLNEEKILFGFSALIHAGNKEVVISEAFLRFMEGLGHKFGLYFPYGPVGENPDYELVIEEDELNRCFEKLGSFEEKYSILLSIEGYVSRQKSADHFFNTGCRSGLSIHITPEGYVEPCNGIQFYTENVLEKGLGQVFQSPFLRDIHACVQAHQRRCIAIYEPGKVLSIVERSGAKESNKRSFSNLSRYSQIFGLSRPGDGQGFFNKRGES